MHESVFGYVAGVVAAYELAAEDVLEIGSLNENGSTRALFTGLHLGLDMRDGPGVDVVGVSHDLPCPADRFGVVVCTEMLEHDPSPWLTMIEIGRVLRTGGILIVTARGNGFPLHAYPDDYWRFMPASFRRLFDLAGCDTVEVAVDPQAPGLFGLARRR